MKNKEGKFSALLGENLGIYGMRSDRMGVGGLDLWEREGKNNFCVIRDGNFNQNLIFAADGNNVKWLRLSWCVGLLQQRAALSRAQWHNLWKIISEHQKWRLPRNCEAYRPDSRLFQINYSQPQKPSQLHSKAHKEAALARSRTIKNIVCRNFVGSRCKCLRTAAENVPRTFRTYLKVRRRKSLGTRLNKSLCRALESGAEGKRVCTLAQHVCQTNLLSPELSSWLFKNVSI